MIWLIINYLEIDLSKPYPWTTRAHYCLRPRTYKLGSLPVAAVHRGGSPGQSTGADKEHQLWLLSYLVYGTDRADVDTKDEKKTEIDTNYPVINFFSVDLDNIYLSMDIYYPKSTK